MIVTVPLPGVPEGMNGRVKTAAGLTWPRYWVEFENGRWIGSVSQTSLVRQKDWSSYQKLREEERLRPKVEAAPVEAATDDGGAPAAGGDSRVPAHLLERSRKARERLAAGG